MKIFCQAWVFQNMKGTGPCPGHIAHGFPRSDFDKKLLFKRWFRRCLRKQKAWRSHQLYWRLHPDERVRHAVPSDHDQEAS